jgi:hypothetical protein
MGGGGQAQIRSDRGALAPAVLAALTFALCYGIALALSRSGVFQYVDVLFDTDAAWFRKGFSDGLGTGTGWGARSVVHPNVANLINPPLRFVAAACSGAGVCDPALVLPRLALIVSPLAAAFEVAFVFLTVRTIYQSETRAIVAALLNLALLPTLVFGAVPESFAMTGCAFAAMFYLASRTAVDRPVRSVWWAVLGVAISSITVTNLWLFALGYAVVHSNGRWFTRQAVLDALRLSAVALAGTGAIAVAIGSAYGALGDYRTPLQQLGEIRAPRADMVERRWTDAVRDGIGQAALGAFNAFPRSLGDTVLPPRPSIHGKALGLDTTGGTIGVRSEPSLHANFRNASADWGTFVALAILAGGVIASAGSGGPGRLVYRMALTLLAANWAFHSVFGIELFLYSKHWSVPVAIVLAAWFEVKRPAPYAGAGLLVLTLMLAAARDASALAHLFRALFAS